MLGMSGAVYPLLICYHGILVVVVEDRVEFCFVFYADRILYTYTHARAHTHARARAHTHAISKVDTRLSYRVSQKNTCLVGN